MKVNMFADKDPCMVKILKNNHSRHLKSLQEIQESKKKKRMVDCSTPETYKFKLKKPKNYLDEFKAQEIYRENQHLLFRLLTLTEKSKKFSKATKNYSKSVPRSMNFQLRKITKEKIEIENKGIANRISSISDAVNHKYIRKEYGNHPKLLSVGQKCESDTKSSKKKSEPLSPLSKKSEFSHSPSFHIKNPYSSTSNEVIKKQWKIAELENSPSSHCIMAIPIAISILPTYIK